MKTTIQQQDGNLVAVLEGRLDTAAAAATEKELQPLYDCEGKNIVFDNSINILHVVYKIWGINMSAY